MGGVPLGRHLDLWASICRSCGWWWPYQRKYVISERSALLITEPQSQGQTRRLHCQEGAALSFRDGWQIYAWHGGFVDAPEVSVAAILVEPSFDARRRGIERMGWHRFLAEAAFPQVGDEVAVPDEDKGTVALYDVPERLFGIRARMLVWLPAAPIRHVFESERSPGW